VSIKQNTEIRNKRAGFEYILVESFIAGIQLLGTEVKSVRDGKVNIADAFCFFKKDELYVRNMHIAEYAHGNINNHEPLRIRKLLLKWRELERLSGKVKERGYSIIPVRMFFNEKNICKIEIALAKGKKAFDKRETIKARESKRELDRIMRDKL
jgi:SsrA-binding protein